MTHANDTNRIFSGKIPTPKSPNVLFCLFVFAQGLTQSRLATNLLQTVNVLGAPASTFQVLRLQTVPTFSSCGAGA